MEGEEASMVVIGSILDLIALGLLGRWQLPHVQRFLEAHGRTEPNYLGVPIARGMGIVLWLLVWLQELLLQGVLLVKPMFLNFSIWIGFNVDGISRIYNIIMKTEGAFRTFAFAATLIFLLGWTDDLIGSKSVKGLRGHFRFWRETRTISMGVVKAVGTLSAAAMVIIVTRNGKIPIWEMGIELLLVTLMTNAMNLLDVRPGRSLKVYLLAALAVLLGFGLKEMNDLFPMVPVIVGGLLLYRHDVQAKGMLGDAGANLLGFTLGYGLIMVAPLALKIFMLVGLIFTHQQAETSSLTRIIEQNRILNWLDQLGRT
jgi:UDP-GlcNAc:undecaprenyl-phosphate/decaprenyl-phosphate GlcNAc-1-phosphate transferase